MRFFASGRNVAVWTAVLCAVFPAVSPAWVQNSGYSWPSGSTILMRLQLSKTATSFIDGSASWNASAATALDVWNAHLDAVNFASGSGSGTGAADGQNSVFFSSSVYGESFGGAIAVTVGWNDAASPTTIVETDVIFNSSERWNSYRGPLRTDSRGRPVFDLRRVALHEFGHVLGLAHPDENGQSVYALMNANVSDLDTLTDDDIAGADFLYGFRITSPSSTLPIPVGGSFRYQITTNRPASSFAATGLPSGLQLDSVAGVISGIPTTPGIFQVGLTAISGAASASMSLRIEILPPRITSPPYAQVEVGTPFSYRITATNNPSSFSASGLPSGLQLDSATGVISGTPTTVASFPVRISATGDFAAAEATITIAVTAPRITSTLFLPPFELGGAVSYQITASNRPHAFTAERLPSGLALDRATGAITGVATLSGVFEVMIIAHGAFGDATAVLRITAQPAAEAPIAFLQVNATAVVEDHPRSRLYVSEQGRGVTVIDMNTRSVVATISTIEFIADMTISADRAKLWAPNFAYQRLSTIDLQTLAPASGPQFGTGFEQVREGLGGRLYLTTGGGITQLDPATGATRQFSPSRAGSGPAVIEISPDRRTLYAASRTELPATLARYDISAAVPVLIEKVTQPGYGQALSVSHNGQLVCLVAADGSPTQAPIPVRAANELSKVHGTLNPGSISARAPVLFSTDDRLMFQSPPAGGSIDIFETATFKRIRQIALPPRQLPWRMAVDGTDTHLFVATGGSGIAVYRLKEPEVSLPPAPAHSLLNVATRLQCETGENVLVSGFIIRGSSPKKVLLRALGRSLQINEAMADPELELYDSSGSAVASNDNWNFHRSEILATGAAPGHERESAIVATLEPDNYTAVVRGVGNGTGVAIAEVYDLQPEQSRIANISTRGKVQSGDQVMIGGFIIGGDQPTRVMVRAIGPSMSRSGVANPLLDTTLDLHDANGDLIAQNDNWRSDQEQEIIDTSIPPTDEFESAIVRTLRPGNYTSIVRGKDDTTGVALVEIYNLE